MQPTEHVDHVCFANTLLKNPMKYFSAKHIHNGEQVIPTAFALHPNIFDVQTEILQRFVCQNLSILNPVTFSMGTNDFSQKELMNIHQSVSLLVIYQIA